MSQCVRGSLVFWLLMMAYIGAFMCTTSASTIRENGKTGEGNHHGASLDSPADIGWRDWLLVEDTQPSPSDANSGLLVRRITPKSVFVAPSFSGCSEGYRQDGMGRCVKLVKVNQAAQLDFLLQKLNSMYAPSSTKIKNDNSDNSGPFHVSLPLGGSDISSNNNKKVPNYEDKQSITSVTIKPTTEEDKETTFSSSYSSISNSSNSNNNDSSSEIGIKKTELLSNISLPTTTTQASESIAIEPQQNNSNTTTNSETTTNIAYINIDTLTTLSSPVESPEENQQTLIESIFDSTVKREPQNKNHSHDNENEDLRNTKKPFVIVVANTTYRPFDSTGADTLSTGNGETVSFVGYDSTPITTNKGIQTATETTMQDTTSFSTIPINNSDTMETITTYDSFTTIFSTTMRTTNEESSILSTTETTPVETISEDLNFSSYPTHITTTLIPNTSIKVQENKEIDQEGVTEEEDEDVYNEEDEDGKLDVLDEDTPSIFGDVIHNNKNIRESSGKPLTRVPGASSIPINLSESIRRKCPELNYGRISYGNTNIDCEPEVTTVRYPIRTTTPRPLQPPYYIRFPVDNRNQGYTKTNNYIRFPEQSASSASSSSFASSPYDTKLWNTDNSASSSSSMWYQPSWFPFLQPHRTWPQDNNNHRNQQYQHQPMSTMYHKQYHQQHLISQNVPSWKNSQSTWSQRD